MAKSGVNDYLAKIYFDEKHPASYAGVDKVYRAANDEGQNISKGQIIKWLRKQDVYTKHKNVKHNFPRLRVVVPKKYYNSTLTLYL